MKRRAHDGWAVVHQSGYVFRVSFRPTRSECLDEWDDRPGAWSRYYRRGYRCVKAWLTLEEGGR